MSENKYDDTVEKLKEAASTGNVHIILGDIELMRDGDATLLISANAETMGEGILCFTMRDGGGFSGLIFTEDCWELMKQKVDLFIEAHRGKNG